MERKYSSKTSLFLIELIIAILFFSIASAICVQLFVQSHFISKATENTNQAVLWTQNVSEVFYNFDGDFDSLKNFYQDSITSNSSSLLSFFPQYQDYFSLSFDQEWNIITEPQEVSYYLYCLYEKDSLYQSITICITENPTNLSELKFSNYDSFLTYLSEHDLWHYEIEILDYQQKGAN